MEAMALGRHTAMEYPKLLVTMTQSLWPAYRPNIIAVRVRWTYKLP